MATTKREKPFWFEASILRNGSVAVRKGLLKAHTAMQALDQVHEHALATWGQTPIKVSLREVNQYGELVMSVGEDKPKALPAPGKPSHTCEFWPHQIGTRYESPLYGTLKLEE